MESLVLLFALAGWPLVDVPGDLGGDYHADIMGHAGRKSVGDGRSTDAHETTHFVNNQIRNRTPEKDNAFYCLGGKAYVFPEPRTKKSDCAGYVPRVLRGGRFDLYVSGQREWNDEPLYVLDEWSAYINGGIVSVQDASTGRNYERNVYAVTGATELGIYSIATAMAIHDRDAVWWREHSEDFRSFMMLGLARVQYLEDYGPRFYPHDDTLLRELRTSSEAEAMRSFIREHFEGLLLEAEQ